MCAGNTDQEFKCVGSMQAVVGYGMCMCVCVSVYVSISTPIKLYLCAFDDAAKVLKFAHGRRRKWQENEK